MCSGGVGAGYVLQLLKNLEGTRQGANLFYKKMKWAQNKCSMYASPYEPNLYRHETLMILSGVFADDLANAYKAELRAEYLAYRTAFSKLIVIDSPGPDTIVPIKDFIGLEIERNRQNCTLTVKQEKYVDTMGEKYKGKYTECELPTELSKAKRDLTHR